MSPRRPAPLRVLITAGPTREYLDPVRFLSNASSGRMGFALAQAARRRRMRVTLVHGPLELKPPPGVRCRPVISATQMLAVCRALWPQHDVLIMAAAVADYTPLRPARTKRRKAHANLTIRLKPTTDILATLSHTRRPDQIVIGFALEDRRPRQRAAQKLRRKRLDAIILNRPAAIGADRSALDILVRGQAWQSWPAAPKSRHAAKIIRLVEALAAQPPSHKHPLV